MEQHRHEPLRNRFRHPLRTLTPASLLPLTGCLTEKNCGCTTELRSNVRLTVRGGQALPDTLRYVRERIINSRTSESILDTLRLETPWICFHEHTGRQRVLVYSNDSLIHQTEWFRVGTVDCCHSEDKTIDLPL